MTVKDAYKNTMDFTGFYKKKKEKVTKLKEIYIFSLWQEDNNAEYKSIHLRTSHNVKKLSRSVFEKKYSKYFSKNIRKNQYYEPSEPLYITSKGLITEEDYLLAQDIMSQIIPIRKNELMVGMKYKSILEKEYLYIGDISGYIERNMEFGINKKYKVNCHSLLLDLKTNRLVYFSNILLLEELGMYRAKISYDKKEIYSKMRNNHIKDGLRYPEFNKDSIYKINSDYDTYMKRN